MKNLLFTFLLLICPAFASNLYAFELVYEKATDTVYSHPHDVVLSADQRYLYVADNGNDRIAVLDPDSLKLLGSFGLDELNEPHDVVFDGAGRLLVADTGGSRIAIYEVDGMQAKLVDELSQLIRRPEGVAVHPNGYVYATGAGSGNIVAYDNGQIVYSMGGLAAPHDVSVAPDGTLWIADSNNNRLLNVTQKLKIIRALEGKPYNFSGPRYLDFDDAGRLYIADKYNHQIKVLAPDLSMLLTLGDPQSTFGPRYFDRPEGITIHTNRVWFADTYNDRIVRYRIVD